MPFSAKVLFRTVSTGPEPDSRKPSPQLKQTATELWKNQESSTVKLSAFAETAPQRPVFSKEQRFTVRLSFPKFKYVMFIPPDEQFLNELSSTRLLPPA